MKMRRTLLGSVIGFAFGIIIVSNLFNMVFAASSHSINIERNSFLMISFLIVSIFSLFGFKSFDYRNS